MWEGDLAPQPLPTHAWLAGVDASDRALLAHCQGPTLDIGCGPGRMTEALALAGHLVLGIDVVPEAVRQTRTRGVPALQRSVFDSVPGEGRWGTALLADGNIGIGGDPVALLERARDLLAADGRVVVDVARPGHRRGHPPRPARDRARPQRTVPVDRGRCRRHRRPSPAPPGWDERPIHRYGDRWWAVVEARP